MHAEVTLKVVLAGYEVRPTLPVDHPLLPCWFLLCPSKPPATYRPCLQAEQNLSMLWSSALFVWAERFPFAQSSAVQLLSFCQ